MSAFEHLIGVDAAARTRVVTLASRVARRNPNGEICLWKQGGWIAVPAEDGLFALPGPRREVLRAAQEAAERLYAVVLDSRLDIEPVIVPATDDALEELSRRYGIFPFVLVPESAGWGVVQAKDELMVMLGTPAVVERLLGASASAATERYREFARDGTWSSQAESHFDVVLRALLTDYPAARDGECVLIPSSY
jgi:hypothetical protein